MITRGGGDVIQEPEALMVSNFLVYNKIFLISLYQYDNDKKVELMQEFLGFIDKDGMDPFCKYLTSDLNLFLLDQHKVK